MSNTSEGLARTKENTRTRLLEAARTLFYARDYQSISIDAIAREAGFTRAAFYLHFSGKDDLLSAMMVAESRQNDHFFRWFERMPPSVKTIEQFLRTLIRRVAVSPGPRLFHLAALQSDAAREAFQLNRMRLMAVLGVGFPAFRPAADDSVAEARRVAEALLAMLQIEQLSVRQSEIADPVLIKQMLLALRDHLANLHKRHPGRRTRSL